MGVSGVGKSSIGQSLADSLDYAFVDADSLHPESSIEKMNAGIPLADDDRWSWLDACAESLNAKEAVVLACSALKRVYRDRIRENSMAVLFLQLDADKKTILTRMENRHHFMKPEMLDSQLAILESISQNEGLVIDASLTQAEILNRAIQYLENEISGSA